MEVGLTAKVSPEVDERATKKEAGKIRGYVEDSLSDVKSSVDLEESLDRVSDMQNYTEEIASSTDAASSNVGALSNRMGEAAEHASNMDPSDGAPVGGSGAGDQQTGGSLKEQTEHIAKTAANTRSLTGMLSQLGNIFLSKGGKMVLAGLGLVFLSRMLDAVSEASPLLGQVFDLLSLATKLFFRPFGHIIGQFLLPIAAAVLQLAAEFNKVFAEEGLRAALTFLATQILAGLSNMVLTTDFIGGITRLALGGLGAKALMGRFLPQIGMRAAIARLLPSIGGKAILSKIGLGGLTRLISGRLTYLIPVVGQLIAVFDLLVWGITALLPGVDAFSPVMWTLTKLFEGLMWTLERVMLTFEWLAGLSFGDIIAGGAGVLDAIMGLWDSITNFLPSIEGLLNMLITLFVFPVRSLIGILDFFAKLSIAFFSWLWDNIESMLSWFPPDLGGLVDLGEMAIEELIEGGIDLANWVASGLGDLADWVVSGLGDLAGWVADGLGTLADWIDTSVDFVVDILGGVVNFVKDILGGVVSFVADILGGVVNFVSDVLGGVVSFTKDILGGSVNFVKDVLGGVVNFARDILGGVVNFVYGILGGPVSFVWQILGGPVSFVHGIIGGVVSFTKDILGGPVDFVKDILGGPISKSELFGSGGGSDDGGDDDGGDDGGFLSDMASAFDVGGGGGDGGGGIDWTKVGRAAAVGGAGGAVLGGPGGALGGAALSGGMALTDELLFASGGIVTGPTSALIGEGGESEAVLPLSRLDSMLSASVGQPSPNVGSGLSLDTGVGEMSQGESFSESDMRSALQSEVAPAVEAVEQSVDNLARRIRRGDLVGDIVIEADGKTIAQLTEDSKTRYQRGKEINK